MTKHHILNIAMLWAAIATIMACGTTNKQPATEENLSILNFMLILPMLSVQHNVPMDLAQ